MSRKKKPSNSLALNRKARHLYHVQESLECGIELVGTEVKSMKGAQFSFSDSYAKIIDKELWLIGLHITQYNFGNRHNHNPDRKRKLLAHKKEIIKLKKKVDEKGLTLIPLRFYLKGGLIKLELGVCKGKRDYDKRDDIKKKDQKRDSDRELRSKFL